MSSMLSTRVHKFLSLFFTIFSREKVPILLWFLWILTGALFYSLYEGFPVYVAIYKSTSIGWAIGWTLPEQRTREDDTVSMLFSSCHNCIGVIFVGLSVMYIADEVTSSKEDWTVQVTNRQNLTDREVSTVSERVKRWILLHKVKMKLVGIALGLIVLGVAGGAIDESNNFPEALDLMVSTLSCCGYKALPSSDIDHWKYIILAFYTNLAVPFFAIALASLISLAVDTPDEKHFYTKIAAPLTSKELKFMQNFGIDDGDGFLDTKEFVVLTIVRIGGVPPHLITNILTRYKTLTINVSSHMISYESIVGYTSAVAPIGRKKRRRRTPVQNMTSFSSVDELKHDEISISQKDILVDVNTLESSSLDVDTSNLSRSTNAEFTKSHHSRKSLVNFFTAKKKQGTRKSTMTRLEKIDAAHSDILFKKLSLVERLEISDSLFAAFITVLLAILRDPYIQSFLGWLAWLLLAALFYCMKMNLSFYRGFYMSVNVGYAVYWTDEESDDIEKAFSICHIILGQVVASFALAAFARGLSNTHNKWYATESAKVEVSRARRATLERVRSFGSKRAAAGDEKDGASISFMTTLLNFLSTKAKQFYTHHRVHVFFLLYLVFGVVWSSFTVGWPIVEGLYFAITSLSTGGHWAIPEDSDDSIYFIVAVFTCTGAPIMCLSGGVFAHWLSSLGKGNHCQRIINAPVTVEELHMMNQLDIDDGDGFIDELEFIILMLVRLKAIRPELIATIIARFRVLDRDDKGAVPYEVFQFTDKRGSGASTSSVTTITECDIEL